MKILLTLFLISLLWFMVSGSNNFLVRTPSWDRKETTFIVDPLPSTDHEYVEYFYTTCQRVNQNVNCSVNRIKHSYLSSLNGKQCNLTLPLEENMDFKFDSLNHMYEDRVFFKWYQTRNGIIENVKIWIVDLGMCNWLCMKFDSKWCKNDSWSSPLNSSGMDVTLTNQILTDSLNSDMKILLSNNSICGDFKNCTIKYDFVRNQFDNPEEFNPKVNLTGMIVQNLMENGYILSGYDPIIKKQKLTFFYGPPSEVGSKDILVLDPAVKYVTAGKTIYNIFCYTDNEIGSKTVKCTDSYGHQLVSNRSIEFPEVVKPIKIVHARRNLESILLSQKANCEGDDCWNIYVTKLAYESKDEKMLGLKVLDTKRVKFDCDGDMKNLVVALMDAKKLDIQFGGINEYSTIVYGCEKLDGEDKGKSYFHSKEVFV